MFCPKPEIYFVSLSKNTHNINNHDQKYYNFDLLKVPIFLFELPQVDYPNKCNSE